MLEKTHEFEWIDGLSMVATFDFHPGTPDSYWHPGDGDDVELQSLTWNEKTFERNDISDHLIDAVENYLMAEIDEWYDPTPEE